LSVTLTGYHAVLEVTVAAGTVRPADEDTPGDLDTQGRHPQ
jgi:hypothetical protein